MTEIVVAVVQPRLMVGQVEANLERVEGLVRDAHRNLRPDVIVLPESMTTPVVNDSRVCAAPRHIDGAPMTMLMRLAAELDCVMTGGALSVRGQHVHQTYMIVEPDGAYYLHNKVLLTADELRMCRSGNGTGVWAVPAFGQQPIGMLTGAEWGSLERVESMHEHRAGLVLGGLSVPVTARRSTRSGEPDRGWQREMSIQTARYLGVSTAMACTADAGAVSRICGPDGSVLAELGRAEGAVAASVPVGRSHVAPLNSARWRNDPDRPVGLRGRSRAAVGSAAYWSHWARRDFPWQDSAHSDIPDSAAASRQPASRPMKAAVPNVLTLTVSQRDVVAEDVVKLILHGKSGVPLPAWRPGAHVDLVLNDGVVRQYSLCGNPNDPFYEIAVLRERAGRGGSVHVHEMLRVGTEVQIRGPRNHFELEDADHYIFVAGGIGITPIRTMMNVARSRGRTCDLFYGGRSRSSMAFASELELLYPDEVNLRPQDSDGLLDFEDILAGAGDNTMVYGCGPEPMLRALHEACTELPGVQLRTERFIPVKQGSTEDSPVSVTVRSIDRILEVPVGVSILSALQNADVDIDYSCRSGICGSCEVRVIGGTPDHRDAVLSQTRPDDRMMPCVSRAVTPGLILDL